jgi:transcriptional regulator with XRE-family HTH domain
MNTGSPRTWTIRTPSDVGRAIAGVRGVRGLRQEDLAEQTSIDRTYLAKLEAGATSIQMERALLALRRMGATVTISLPQSDGPAD